MARINYFERVLARIEELSAGEVFIISDFSDIADTTVVRKVLSRLEEDGKIRRIMRGVYDRPEYNNFLGEYVEPVPDKVAHALARNFGWTIVPCGDTALNMLGLSTQVPAVWLYVSDGTYKEYTYNNTTIQFKRTTNKENFLQNRLGYSSAQSARQRQNYGRNDKKDKSRHFKRRKDGNVQ